MAVELVSLGLVCADVVVRPVEGFPERGKLSLVPHLEIHLGGLAGVTATVFRQLGGQSAFIGKIGADGFGDYIAGTMAKVGVDLDHLRRTPDLGSASTVVLVGSDGERTFLHHQGASTTLCEDDIDFAVVERAKVLHWGGPAVTPDLDGEPIGRVLKRARDAGVTTSMDTCYDGGGVWLPRIEQALPHLDIAMTSIDEARMYTGKQTREEVADFFLSYGATIAMVKLGGEGLFVKSAEEAHHLPPHKANVVDTTGAGDAACGGFLYGYVQEWDMLRCARLANAVGGLTVQCMGGAEAIQTLDETLAFMETG
jgi:sugar/nucleoside kinase (ribokinase family)